MKKKNSVIVTLIVTLVILALAAFIFVQPYLNTTAFTADENIASFLGQAFGKYPRFINEKDFEKVEVLEIGSSDGYQFVSIGLDGFIEKRDAYLEAYDNATAEGLEAPEMPDFSKELFSFQTDAGVENFVGIEKFKNLVEVSVMAEAFPVTANLEEFKGAAKLESLSITSDPAEDAVKIDDISALADKTALKTLSLANNNISDISALSGLVNLEAVALDSNAISDISALSGKDKITSLSLTTNDISDISVLSTMPALETVSLDENQITDISAISNIETITTLSVGNNSITDITPITTLKNLYIVSLSGNAITDISPLSAFKDSTAQMYILLSENEGINDWSVADALPENIMIVGKPEAQATTDETVAPDETAEAQPEAEATEEQAEQTEVNE